MKTTSLTAKTFGIAFLIGYISYGLGFGLINVNLNSETSLSIIHASKNLFVLEAAILMAVFAPVNIVLGILMTPLFKRYHASLSYAYLSAAIVSSVLLILGAIFLLALIPLSDEYVKTEAQNRDTIHLVKLVLTRANFYSYQIAMVIWGLGGLAFCYLLNISGIVPKWLWIWGFIAYLIFIAGAIFALFGYNIDVLLDIPGGLFEIYLSIRFIVKGFDTKEVAHSEHQLVKEL